MSRRVALAIALFAVSSAGAVHAGDTMRCGSQVVSTGMTKDEVLDACGKPDQAEDIVQPVRAGKQVVGQTTQSRWTYSSSTVTRVLVFDQERLISIELN